MNFTDFLQKIKTATGKEPRKSGKNYACRCTGHDDRNASLSVGQGDDGRILLRCFAGCTAESIVQAMGLSMSDLMPSSNGHTTTTAAPKPKRTWPTAAEAIKATTPPGHTHVATYVYRDALRCDYAAVARYDGPTGKTIRPFAHLAAGGWQCGDPSRWVPYRIDDVADNKTVFIVEGEKCCDQAWLIGLPCITSAHGSQSAAKTDWAALAGKSIVILPDADTAGEKYAADVAGILHGLGCKVKIVRLPGLSDGGDIVDYLAAIPDDGLSPEQICEDIQAMADKAAVWQPAASDADAAQSDGVDPVDECLGDFERAQVSWLWAGRFPIGKLSMLVGRPGEGKSFLTAYMAAMVSTGGYWTDGTVCERGTTIMIVAEDDPADAIGPRVDAHGGDSTRIRLLRMVSCKSGNVARERSFTLSDLPQLEKMLIRYPDTRLVTIDPIGSFIGGKTDSHRDNEIRDVLQPVALLAAKYRTAIITVAHHRKSTSTHADDMTLGSVGFVGIARAIWHLGRDAENPDRRLLLAGKQSYSRSLDGLAFSIPPTEPGDPPPAIIWETEPVKMSADDHQAAVNGLSKPGPEPDARDGATAWLRELLKNGSKPVSEIETEAKGAGYSWRTVRRAKDDLKIVPERAGFGACGGWRWMLPP